MEIPAESIKREYVHPVYPCHLCKAQFFSSIERNDHLETHFTRQQCPSCNHTLILIDAELYVITPHLPSRCLKQRVDGQSDAHQPAEVAESRRNGLRKSILSEPNIRVDGHTDCVPKRKRISDRIKRRHFARVVEATLEDDENDSEEEPVQNENIVIQVRSRSNAGDESDEIIIEVDETDDETAVDIKDESDIKEEDDDGGESACQLQEQASAEHARRLTRRSVALAAGMANGALLSRSSTAAADENTELQADYLDHELTAETDVEQTLNDLISSNVADDLNDVADGALDDLPAGYDDLLNSGENDPLDMAPRAQSKVVVIKKKMRITKRKSWTDKDPADGRSKVLCDICNEGMAKNRILSHIRFVHLGLRTMSDLECDTCGIICSNVSNLKQHKRRHIMPKPYTCTFCNKGFNGQYHLKEHINVHTGEKPHVCEHCGRRFSRSSLKSSHMRIHTGERPFKCKILGCLRDFRYNSDLRRHEYSVHGILYTKHTCLVCDKVFPERKMLKNHLSRHCKKAQ